MMLTVARGVFQDQRVGYFWDAIGIIDTVAEF